MATLALALSLFMPVTLAGNPIPDFDSHIVCFGAPPPAAAFPVSRPWDLFFSNQQLCAATGGLPWNLGCRCNEVANAPECSLQNGADPVLYSHDIPRAAADGWTSFHTWCVWKCACASSDEAAEWQAKTPMQQASSSDLETMAPVDGFNSTHGTDGSSAPILPLNDPYWWGSEDGGNVDVDSVALGTWKESPVLEAKCNGTCEIEQDCSGSDCHCRVTGSKYEPGAGTVNYYAGCVYATSIKRDEQQPCPCNRTYVSHRCCGVEDGFVWEGAQAKLGELVLDEGRDGL